MQNKQDAAQLQSLVLHPVGRASHRKPNQTKMTKTPACSILKSDEESFVFSYWLGIELLMRDLPCSPGVVGGFKTLLSNVLNSEDLLGFIDCCSKIRAELVQLGSWTSAFKRLDSRWARGLCTAIEHAVETNLIQHPSPIFDQVATFLGWLKRLPVCIRPPDDGVADYYRRDRYISNFEFESDVVAQLSSIWHEWFGSFRITQPFRAKHGSGSTADAGRIRSQKWKRIGWDRVARVCLRDEFLKPVLDWSSTPRERMSKVVFVPKQAGKDRTICMEPAWLQYLQQGVADQLIKFTHQGSHPLSKLINIFDQSVNRELCSDAWLHRLATIDLTDASDSVSWRLIKRLTHGLPLERYLHACRSTSTVIDGRVISFDKFAPMGSALCFPIECILFASVVELAHRIHYGKVSRGSFDGCSVYGDDIICPVELYELIVDILQALGFIVNASKSFSSGGYYESCGVEYLYGCLINTIKHPRAHLKKEQVVSPSEIGLVTDLANDLLQARYFLARRTLLQDYCAKSVQVGSKLVPFADLLQFDEKHLVPLIDDYTRTYWDTNTQRRVSQQLTVQTTPTRSAYDFQQWKSGGVDRTRRERIGELYHHATKRDVHPKWSRRAVALLSKTHQWDLLAGDDIEDVGTSRTGRPGYKLRKVPVPL